MTDDTEDVAYRAKIEEKIGKGVEERLKGNESFKDGNWVEALRAYHNVLFLVKGLDLQRVAQVLAPTDTSKPSTSSSEPSTTEPSQRDLRKEVDEMLVATYGNMAACQIKRNQWGKVVEYAEEVLKRDELNRKAKFRLAQGRLGLGETNKARTMLEELQKAGPDPAVGKLLEDIEKDEKARKAKSDTAMRGWLKKGRVSNDEENAKYKEVSVPADNEDVDSD